MFLPRQLRPTLFALVSLLCSSFTSVTAEDLSSSPTDLRAEGSEAAGALPDGLYLVLRSADSSDKVCVAEPAERLLVDDSHFLQPEEREPVKYLVLQTAPFVPLILAADPKEDREESGKPRLQLELADDQKRPLEEFSRANLGKTVAIVIGGEVVTRHKVRSTITGGRLQVTRCTDHGCEVLYTKLLKKGM